jgi:hypothetical protein
MTIEFDFSLKRWFVGYWKIGRRHCIYIGPFAMGIQKKVDEISW